MNCPAYNLSGKDIDNYIGKEKTTPDSATKPGNIPAPNLVGSGGCQFLRSSGSILKSNLLIIDEIGYTPIERRKANLFFNLISELYEKQSIIITSNKSFSVWAEMLGDEIMTTAMLDRLLHHSRVFNLDGRSYRIQTKKEVETI